LLQSLSDIDILDPELLADPYPFYERLLREAPVWQAPGLDLFLVSSWDLVAEATGRVEELSSHLTTLVVTDPDGRPSLFDTSEFGPGSTTLATADPPEHTVHRKAVFPELVAREMARMEPVIRAAVGQRLNAARHQRSIEWTSAVANPIPMIVVARLFGFPPEDHALLLEWAFNGTDLLAGTNTLEEMARLVASADAASAYIADRLDGALAAPRQDLIGAVTSAVSSGVLSRADGIGTLVILLGAGGESTASLIGNAVRILAEEPNLQAKLRADPPLIPAFVEEAIRLQTPFRGHFRQARRETELGGITIPTGATVFLLWAAANRDADEFDRPDQVLLDRRLAHHMGFGRGIHFCVGAPLARLEAKVTLEMLLAHTASFQLDPARPPAYVSSVFVRRHQHLDLLVDWRHAPPARP
jgi:cytochrome P450 family 144